MDLLVIVLRLVHVVLGAIWVGMMTFTTFFLMPAMMEAGPEGGKVMAALQRRRLMTVMPLIALLTIVSGVWLMARLYGANAAFMSSPMGMSLMIGALAALLALLLGVFVGRPAMARAAASTDPAEIGRLRARAAAVSRIAALLVLLAAGAMAVARYL